MWNGWDSGNTDGHELIAVLILGAPLKDASSYLAPAVVSGMLAGGKKEATLVNAMLLAQEAGLKVLGVPHVSPMPPHPILPWYNPTGRRALRGHPM